MMIRTVLLGAFAALLVTVAATNLAAAKPGPTIGPTPESKVKPQVQSKTAPKPGALTPTAHSVKHPAPAPEMQPVPSAKLKAMIAAAAGDAAADRGLGAPVVLTPRAMYIDQRTFMTAAGDVSVLPGEASGGVISIYGRYGWVAEEWATQNYVGVHFRAQPNTHYLVDCIVSGAGGADLLLSVGGAWLGGSATREGDHLLRLLPASPTRRDVQGWVTNSSEYAETLTYTSVHRCEISPLRAG